MQIFGDLYDEEHIDGKILILNGGFEVALDCARRIEWGEDCIVLMMRIRVDFDSDEEEIVSVFPHLCDGVLTDLVLCLSRK